MARKRRAQTEDEDERSPVAERWRGVLRGFLFGRDLDEATEERLREIKGLALLGGSLFLALATVSYYAPYGDPSASAWNWGGQVGFFLANLVMRLLGNAGYLLVFLGLAWSLVMLAGRRVPLVSLRVVGGSFFVFSTAFLLQQLFGPGPGDGTSQLSSRTPYGPGGMIALAAEPVLVEKFGHLGLFLLLGLTALVSFLLATEMAFVASVRAFGAWLAERRERRGESLPAAVAGYARRMLIGVWNFVRGADLREGLGAPAQAAALALPAAQAAARTRVAGPRVQVVDSDDLEEEIEDELEEDEEYGEDEDESDEGDDGEAEDSDEDDEDEEEEDEEEDEGEDEDGEEEEEELELQRELLPAARRAAAVKTKVAVAVFEPPTPPPGPWTLPPIEVLIPPDPHNVADDKFLESSAAKLENTLRSFGVESQVVSAQVGPAVTLFELTVSEGTRMNKVSQLSQEIAAALRAQSVRVIAPIPGRATIGVEVPNLKRRLVRISELINQRAYDPRQMALPLFLGMDAEGGAVVEDLARMPHILIAGTTGSGKSVCINSILASLLLTRSPDEVKMILIDPKMVELQMFANVPHLMCPVVTDARQATAVLLWMVEKMEGRYELFKAAGVKNVKGYNALGEAGLKQRLGDEWSDERTPRHLPYVVVVIDEFADLMAVSRKEAELAITRLAQKSRSAGVHVVVATQRPSTDVITGVIKGNLPTRVAFQVASKVDSRVILDAMGADKLLGHGDMLFLPPGGSKLRRVQGALVEDAEVQRLVDFVCQHSVPTFSQELVQVATGQAQPGGMVDDGAGEDTMFDEAVRVILKSKRGSASLLQRALGIGYTRASRLIDIMTERGIVGPHRGSKVREIMISLEDWEEQNGPPPGPTGERTASQGVVSDE